MNEERSTVVVDETVDPTVSRPAETTVTRTTVTKERGSILPAIIGGLILLGLLFWALSSMMAPKPMVSTVQTKPVVSSERPVTQGVESAANVTANAVNDAAVAAGAAANNAVSAVGNAAVAAGDVVEDAVDRAESGLDRAGNVVDEAVTTSTADAVEDVADRTEDKVDAAESNADESVTNGATSTTVTVPVISPTN